MIEEKYTVIPTDNFRNAITKLSNVHEALVWEKLSNFKKNPFHPSFRTKKMKGRSGYYESSVNMDIRIVWTFVERHIIAVTDVGHHDVLNKY